MNKFLSLLLFVVALSAGTTSAFTSPANKVAAAAKPSVADMPSYASSSSSSSTALNLKVKVDPNAKTKNVSGQTKAAAYGGSIVIAVALPVVFLVWSTLSKAH
jgi:hypothetical protein